MPKSRNRKNHKKKVQARKMRVIAKQNEMVKQMEELKKKYDETKDIDTGEVPFTLGDK
tara:strand:- start:176 stop:349 length:174 start_codon:yes stop_codon:yes gene_type:complete